MLLILYCRVYSVYSSVRLIIIYSLITRDVHSCNYYILEGRLTVVRTSSYGKECALNRIKYIMYTHNNIIYYTLLPACTTTRQPRVSPVYCTDDKGTLAVFIAVGIYIIIILYYTSSILCVCCFSPFFYRKTKAISFRIRMPDSRGGVYRYTCPVSIFRYKFM